MNCCTSLLHFRIYTFFQTVMIILTYRPNIKQNTASQAPIGILLLYLISTGYPTEGKAMPIKLVRCVDYMRHYRSVEYHYIQ